MVLREALAGVAVVVCALVLLWYGCDDSLCV